MGDANERVEKCLNRQADEIARLTKANAALLAYAVCEQTLVDVSRKHHGVFFSEVIAPLYTPYGWDGEESPDKFLTRLRKTALALNAKGGPDAQ